MSKLKVVNGSNVTSITAREREIKMLETEIQNKATAKTLTNRDLVVYAYHFVRLEHPLLARKYLNKLTPDYFDVDIYKDLFQALLAWSITETNPQFKNAKYARAYEYFVVVKRCVASFDNLDFELKPAFVRFKKSFMKCSRFTNLT